MPTSDERHSLLDLRGGVMRVLDVLLSVRRIAVGALAGVIVGTLVAGAAMWIARSTQNSAAVTADLAVSNRTLLDFLADCLNPQGPECGKQLAERSASRDQAAVDRDNTLLARVEEAIARTTALQHRLQESENGRRTDAAIATRREADLRAALAELATALAALQSAQDGRPVPPTIPGAPTPTTVPPPPLSAAVCGLLGGLGRTLGLCP